MKKGVRDQVDSLDITTCFNKLAELIKIDPPVRGRRAHGGQDGYDWAGPRTGDAWEGIAVPWIRSKRYSERALVLKVMRSRRLR